jgi:hypothetical protein
MENLASLATFSKRTQAILSGKPATTAAFAIFPPPCGSKRTHFTLSAFQLFGLYLRCGSVVKCSVLFAIFVVELFRFSARSSG